KHWKKNGETKHHLIDPATGQSSQSDLASVTVVAPDAMTADVWAKSLFLSGKKKGLEQAKKMHLAALFITKTDEVIASKHLLPYVWKTG
ncbi:MAG: FAD:protein FMN transferase, partial [Candidatus Moraniibacteriota bacterium]